jgi:fatty-acyl-CoA synthase
VTLNDASPCFRAESLPGLLRALAGTKPDALAVIERDVSLSFAELLARSEALATGLSARGIRRGMRVGLLQANSIDFVASFMGIGILGAVAVPFSTWSTAAELSFLVADSDVTAILAQPALGDRDLLTDLHAACRAAGYAALTERIFTPKGIIAADTEQPTLWATDPGDDAMILYTSGSTSRPKGVRLSQRDCAVNGFHIGERQGLRPGDRVFLAAPLFWSYGLANALPATFGHGATLVLTERFDPVAARQMIRRHQCTAIYTLPALTDALLTAPGYDPADFATLRTGVTIGTAADLKRAALGLGVAEICNIYGATETYGNCCVTWHHWPLERRMECQGPPLPGQIMRFRDPESGMLLPSGVTGLAEVSGRVSPGYIGASAAHNDAVFTADGYYRTGDLGHLDADGCFCFVGRDSDMIKRSGINVSPSEVEQALQGLPGISQCVVVGVPDDRLGEAIAALVVAVGGQDLNATAIRAGLRVCLSSYKLPDHFLKVEALPLTATGKIQRRHARDRAVSLLTEARVARDSGQ